MTDPFAWPDVLLLVGAAAPVVALAVVGVWALVSLPRRLARARAELAAQERARRPLIDLSGVDWSWPELLRDAAGVEVPAALHIEPYDEGRASTCLTRER